MSWIVTYVGSRDDEPPRRVVCGLWEDDDEPIDFCMELGVRPIDRGGTGEILILRDPANVGRYAPLNESIASPAEHRAALRDKGVRVVPTTSGAVLHVGDRSVSLTHSDVADLRAILAMRLTLMVVE